MLQKCVQTAAGTTVIICGLQMGELNVVSHEVTVQKLSVLVCTICSEFSCSFVLPEWLSYSFLLFVGLKYSYKQEKVV